MQQENNYLEILDQYLQDRENLKEMLRKLISMEQINLEQQKDKIHTALDIEFSSQKLDYTAQARIKNELKNFRSKNVPHIEVYEVSNDQAILNHCLIIVMHGQKDTPFEGGLYTFLLKFPENYPYKPPYFRSLLPIKHPHIYPNMRLCTPTIQEHYAVQSYSLYELLQTWYTILHRKPNELSLANTSVYEQFDEEFIKLQAQFLSVNNPIFRLFKRDEEFIKV